MKELVASLDGAADGAFIVDEELEIVYANPSVENILGFDREEFEASFCYQVLNGRDEKQRLVCQQHCLIANRIFSDKRVTDFDLKVAAGEGGRRWINVTVFRYLDGEHDEPYIVHLFRDITQKKKEVLLVERLMEVARNYHNIDIVDLPPQETGRHIEKLTDREREVLGLLAQGLGTHEISQQLSISDNTTRNHIQHILAKLAVHSRLEAVIYAIDHELIHDPNS